MSDSNRWLTDHICNARRMLQDLQTSNGGDAKDVLFLGSMAYAAFCVGQGAVERKWPELSVKEQVSWALVFSTVVSMNTQADIPQLMEINAKGGVS